MAPTKISCWVSSCQIPKYWVPTMAMLATVYSTHGYHPPRWRIRSWAQRQMTPNTINSSYMRASCEYHRT